jgi:hypothetical protein
MKTEEKNSTRTRRTAMFKPEEEGGSCILSFDKETDDDEAHSALRR